MSTRSNQEHLVCVNSTYRDNPSSNPCNFQQHFKGAVYATDVDSVRVHSATIPNMFPNIYGLASVFYFNVNGQDIEVKLPDAVYETAQELADILCLGLEPSLANTCTATVNDDVVTLTSTTPFTIYGVVELAGKGIIHSLNHVLGYGLETLTNQTSLSATYPVSLNGVRKVYVSSQTLAFGRSVHGDGVQSHFLSVPMTVPWGYVQHMVVHDVENNHLVFRDHIDCNTIDIQVMDEYGQILSLPVNQHVELQIILGSRLE